MQVNQSSKLVSTKKLNGSVTWTACQLESNALYIKETKKSTAILFGITGKYNLVYQCSKGNMRKRIIVEVNDLVATSFLTHMC